eukprot:8200454-Pyramimonas_sp.AAC.1
MSKRVRTWEGGEERPTRSDRVASERGNERGGRERKSEAELGAGDDSSATTAQGSAPVGLMTQARELNVEVAPIADGIIEVGGSGPESRGKKRHPQRHPLETAIPPPQIMNPPPPVMNPPPPIMNPPPPIMNPPPP